MSPAPKIDDRIGIENVKGFLKQAELDSVQTEFMSRLVTILIASMGLVTALAWDDVLRTFFVTWFSGENTIVQKLYYALALTFIATLVSIILSKLVFSRHKKKINTKK